MLYLDDKSFQRILITVNHYDNLEYCYFILNDVEYFKKFNTQESLRKKFASSIAPLITKVKINKKGMVVSIHQNMEHLFIVKEGSLDCYK